MISFEFNEIFVSSIRIMQSLTMMWLNKVILLTRAKQSWYETFLAVGYGLQVIDVKASFFLDRALDERHGGSHQEFWNFCMTCC